MPAAASAEPPTGLDRAPALRTARASGMTTRRRTIGWQGKTTDTQKRRPVSRGGACALHPATPYGPGGEALRQRIAPRAYGPAIRLAAARSGYHARRPSHNLPTLDPQSSHFSPTMSQATGPDVTDRLPIGSDRLGIDWPRGGERFREDAERLGQQQPQHLRDLIPKRKHHPTDQERRRPEAPFARLVPKRPKRQDQERQSSHNQTAPAPAPAFHAHSAASRPSVGSAPSPSRCATHFAAPQRELMILSRVWSWRA